MFHHGVTETRRRIIYEDEKNRFRIRIQAVCFRTIEEFCLPSLFSVPQLLRGEPSCEKTGLTLSFNLLKQRQAGKANESRLALKAQANPMIRGAAIDTEGVVSLRKRF